MGEEGRIQISVCQLPVVMYETHISEVVYVLCSKLPAHWLLLLPAHRLYNTTVTHKFELHFVVALLECEYKEYEDRHVHHEGNEAVVAVEEQEELLGGEEGGEGQAGERVWRGGGGEDTVRGREDATTLQSIVTHQAPPKQTHRAGNQVWKVCGQVLNVEEVVGSEVKQP